jgi:CRP-like cAMP-binding protein
VDENDTPSFLDSLTADEADALHASGRRRRYPRGTALFHEHQAPAHVVLLLRGRTKIVRLSEDGKEVLLAVRGPGDLIGELSAIDGRPRSATAVALEPAEGLVLTSDEFHDFLGRHSRVSLELLKMLSRRLRDADGKRLGYGSQDVMGRVAARLVELADRFGEEASDGVHISLPITQEELAGWTGCSREAVSKALQGMRSLGWLETGRRAMVIRDRDALCRRAGVPA